MSTDMGGWLGRIVRRRHSFSICDCFKTKCSSEITPLQVASFLHTFTQIIIIMVWSFVVILFDDYLSLRFSNFNDRISQPGILLKYRFWFSNSGWIRPPAALTGSQVMSLLMVWEYTLSSDSLRHFKSHTASESAPGKQGHMLSWRSQTDRKSVV